MDENSKRDATQADRKTIAPTTSEEVRGAEPSLIDIVSVIADRVDPIIQIIRTFAETSLKTRQSDSRFRIQMALIAVIVVAIVVGVATLLTFSGKMDGSTYGFLLGLITGYALTFIRDAIKPGERTSAA